MLADALENHPTALRADFQRFYGLNLDGMGADYTVEHAAALAACLPRESATMREKRPELEWGETEYLLALIEYDIRCMSWDGKGSRPKPMDTPADAMKTRKARPASRAELRHLADLLGIPEDRR